MKKNVLITGSTGFIGRNLMERLGKKYILLTPTHSELELTDQKDVENYFKSNKINVVIHCATTGSGFKGGKIEKIVQQPDVIKQNLQMFFNIINNSKYYQKFINCGTGAEYDKRFNIKKIKETDFGKHMPIEEYAFSKYLISKYIENTRHKVIYLRFFGVFGKYEDYGIRFISKSICRNLLNRPIEINQNAFFDYTYINDAIKIIDYFVQHEASKKFYNVGTGKPIDLLTLAGKINKIVDQKSKIIIKKDGLNKEYTCDNTKLMNELGDFKFTSIDKAIREMYEYYKEKIDVLDMTNK